MALLNAFLAENLLGIKTVHAFNRESTQVENFSKLNNDYASAQFASVRVNSLFQPSITLATGISMTLAIWIGGDHVLKGSIPIGVLVSFFAYISSLYQPVREIADKWNMILAGLTSAERVFNVLEWPTESADLSKEACALSKVKGHICFENVWFAYKDENWILKDFNFEVRPGDKVGVVGPTGAGKTTIINLLLRYYEPQKGRILIDGTDIRELNLRDWRASLGFIQQDVFLFSGSLKDNITLDRQQPHNSQIQESSFRQWPKEKEFHLHEGGINISRGERQVVAFCRALYSDPKIWILDEATANVDSTSEKGLEGLLETHAQGRTCFVIAHRLSTVRNVDKILLVSRQGSFTFTKQAKTSPTDKSSSAQSV
jgi:ABC-type multidrug transport system fused ATPase/permease subunit